MFYVLFGVVLGVFLYYKVVRLSEYWDDRDVVHEPSWPIVGNMWKSLLRQKNSVEITVNIYRKYATERCVGYMLLSRPILMLRDLDLIKQLTDEDFEHFLSNSSSANTHNDSQLAKSLVSLTGEDLLRMKTTLSTIFTSSNMQFLYSLTRECAQNFVGHFRGKEQLAVEMKDIFSRFTTDVIATTAFGVNINSVREPRNSFFMMARKLSHSGLIQSLKIMVLAVSSRIAACLGIQLLQNDATDVFRKIVKDDISKRAREGTVRSDLIHLLMEAQTGQFRRELEKRKGVAFSVVDECSTGKSMKLSYDHVAAQAIVFFFAVFDTTSSCLSFMAYELAINQDVQKKLQKKIDSVNRENQGEISYEALLNMRYLDQVVSETLRLWPPEPETNRVCVKDYKFDPKTSNNKIILIEKDVSIVIPIMAIQRDAQYYPEPERFYPDRFNEENKSNIVAGSYLPFGVGLSKRIGSKFVLLQMKVLFFYLLLTFDITIINDTPIPIKVTMRKFNLQPENGFKLGLKPRHTIYPS